MSNSEGWERVIIDGVEIVLETGQDFQYGPVRPHVTVTTEETGTTFVKQNRDGQLMLNGPDAGMFGPKQLEAVRVMFLRYNSRVGDLVSGALGRRWVRYPGDTITVGLVACGGKKRDVPSRAEDLYIGDLFVKERAFVKAFCDDWAILSAKHKLLDPSKVIEPYDLMLGETLRSPDFRARQPGESSQAYEQARARYWETAKPVLKMRIDVEETIRAWSSAVSYNCYMRWGEDTHYVVLAGENYRKAFDVYNHRGFACTFPLEGLGIGEQLSWLKKETAVVPPNAEKKVVAGPQRMKLRSKTAGGS